MTVSEATAPAIHPRLDASVRRGSTGSDSPGPAAGRGRARCDRPATSTSSSRPADAERLRETAGRLGFARLPRRATPAIVFLIAYDGPTETWLKLDVGDRARVRPVVRLPAAVGRDRELPRSTPAGRRGLRAGPARRVLGRTAPLRCSTSHGSRMPRSPGWPGDGRAGPGGGPAGQAVARLLPSDWSTDAVVDAVGPMTGTGSTAVATGLARSWRRRSPVGTTARRIGPAVRRRVDRIGRRGSAIRAVSRSRRRAIPISRAVSRTVCGAVCRCRSGRRPARRPGVGGDAGPDGR